MKKIATALCLVWLVAAQARAAIISGSVRSAGDAAPLVDASVLLEGTHFGAATDQDGNYVIFNIPPGTFVTRASMIGFKSSAQEVTVSEGSESRVDFQLAPAAIQLKESVIKGAAAKGTTEREIEDRMTASIVSDAISGELIKRLPDPDIAQVVRRVTGVSSVGGDPVIRGLGVRYSKVTLNNSPVSGTEPNRSGVSLELFPSSMMKQVTVNKSYLPDQFGEFAGGVINMNTWDFPGKAELAVSFSTGYRAETTFHAFRTYDGGGADFLGYDDGTRAIPAPVKHAGTKIALRGLFSQFGYTATELEELGESFTDNWNTHLTKALPDQSYSLSYANHAQVLGRPLGFILSWLYKNSYNYRVSDRQVLTAGAGEQPVVTHTYHLDTWTNSVKLGAMASLRYDPSPLASVTYNMMYDRLANDETRFYAGYNEDRAKLIRDTRLRFVGQGLLNHQLSGRQVMPSLGKASLNWQLGYSEGSRYEPDTREVQYEKDPAGDSPYLYADETQSGSRIYNRLIDHTYTANMDWLQPAWHHGRLKFGAALLARRRGADSRFFQFEPRDNADVDFSLDPENLFSAANIGMSGFMLREATRPTDSYRARQDLYAGYAMADVQALPKLRLIGGVRLEHSRQEVTSYELFTVSQIPVKGRIQTDDLLPALNVIYSPRDRVNLRFAASRTVSRPDFRELSEFEFTDLIGGYPVIGNPNLKRALVHNLDLRWEWANGNANLLAASVFYKQFVNPIEVVIQPTAQHRVSYENARSADNYGLELEARQEMGDLSERLNNWAISANLTLLRSNIQLSDSSQGIQTSPRRPLHGQSPYLINFSLTYAHPHYHTEADALLNVFGKRIAQVGTKPLPDIYELPHPALDITLSQPLSAQFRLNGAVRNLLDPPVRFRQGSMFTEEYREGRIISLGFSYQN